MTKKHEGASLSYISMKKRTLIIFIVFSIFASDLIVNLFKLQYLGHDYYYNKAYEQITTSSPMKAARGNIYDSNMNLLATNATSWRIFVSPRAIKTADKDDNANYAEPIARELSKILSLDYKNVYSKITNSKVLDVTIKKSANEKEYRSVLEFVDNNNYEDLVFTEAKTTRYYPNESMAAHLLGFTGSDNQGLYGLEYYYNSTLSGIDGYYLYGKDANGNSLPSDYSSYTEAIAGHSLVTTIDSYVQSELESQLERIRVNHSVQNRVTGIVMDVNTGAILAMATSSPFNPNSPYELDSVSLTKLYNSGYAIGSDEYKKLKSDLQQTMWSNKAISETYEPGSTFKIVTVSTALDIGVPNINDHFSCCGYYNVGGWRIKCHKVTGHGSNFNLAYGLQMSCNPTMMVLSERIGATNFYNYVEKFGYFEKTGIDLPGEAGTIFHDLSAIGATELATISFGQRFKVTPIAHLRAVAAVANGGVIVTPYVVEKVLDKDGNIVSEHEENENRRIISEEVANQVATILEEGVSGDGGAKNSYVEGYKVAAKTGTSQKFDILDENGNSYLRIGSTVAFSPSDERGIAVLIIVDEPTCAVKYGSVVSAPYISSLLTNILPYLEYTKETVDNSTVVENFVGMSINTVKSKLDKTNIPYEIVGDGEVVISQTPSHHTFNGNIGQIIIYTVQNDLQYTNVPNVVGMDPLSAIELLVNSGLKVKICGKYDTSTDTVAKVSEQSMRSGICVTTGTEITITVINYGFED